MIPGIYEGADFYTFKRLKEKPIPDHPALVFCHNWLNGQGSFELLTSGSTGNAKPLLLQREKMQASAMATRAFFEGGSNDHLLLCLNITSIGGLMQLVRAMEWNCNLTIVPASSDPLSDIPNNHPFTIVSIVPLQLYAILNNNTSSHKLKRFRSVIIGGAPVKQSTLKLLNAYSTLFYHSYGMTETCSHIALRRLNGKDKDENFKPLPGIDVRINMNGCLEIKGLVTGNEWLTTTDLAVIYPDRSFEIRGRYDQVINSGGVKVNPEKIEQAAFNILEEKGVHNNLFAFGQPDDKLGERIVLFVEGETLRPLRDQLLEALRQKLNRYEVPKAIIFAPTFFQTATGKTDKRKTAAYYGNG